MSTSDQLIVITGAPSAGKTTLIDALRGHGYACVPDAGPAVARERAAIGEHVQTPSDALLFADVILAWHIRTHGEASDLYGGIVFFDGGIPDVAGQYLRVHRAVPPHVTAMTAVLRYHRRVFVAPPWARLYRPDGVHHHDFAQAVHAHDATVRAYLQHGYEPLTLPKAGVAERVEFVRQHLPVQASGC